MRARPDIPITTAHYYSLLDDYERKEFDKWVNELKRERKNVIKIASCFGEVVFCLCRQINDAETKLSNLCL